MKNLAYLLLSMSVISGCTMAEPEISAPNIEAQGFAPEFKRIFKDTYSKGPNFNSEDFVLTYPCGGGAICGSIFDSSRGKFVSFPEDFIGASEIEKFRLKFNKSSNQICFWGQSAYTSESYQNVCFVYDGETLKPRLGRNVIENST